MSNNPAERWCARGKHFVPLGDFGPNKRMRDGLNTSCKNCDTLRVLAAREGNQAAQERDRQWRLANAERLREGRRKRRRRLRQEVLAAYGGRCACPGGCVVTSPEFLALDHVHNDGSAHRAKVHVSGVYAAVKKEGFPQGKYRLLCHNCNMARGLYGACPHELER